MNDAMERKKEKYTKITEDIHSKGYSVQNMPFEIGARGFINERNLGVLASVSAMCKIKDLKNLRRNLARIALLGSYRIWLARHSQEWSPGPLMT